MKASIRDYLAAIGRKGGQVRSKNKSRGNAEYYRELAQKSAAKRRAKKEEKMQTIHVTAIRNNGVYGHPTDRCDESGCNSDEFFYKAISPDEVEVGHCYEVSAIGAIHELE